MRGWRWAATTFRPTCCGRRRTAEVQGLFLDGLRDIVRTRDVPGSWSDWPVILAPKPGKDRRLLRKRRDITLLPHAWALFDTQGHRPLASRGGAPL